MLSNTGIRFRYSTTKYEAAVTGLEPGRGTMPDFPAALSIDDYLTGGDSVMDYAIRLAIEG